MALQGAALHTREEEEDLLARIRPHQGFRLDILREFSPRAPEGPGVCAGAFSRVHTRREIGLLEAPSGDEAILQPVATSWSPAH